MYKRIAYLALWAGALAACGGTAEPSDAQSWRTMTSERQVADLSPHDVRVQFGAGTLRVQPAESPTLYRFDLRYDEEYFTPVVDYDQSARTIRLGVTTGDRGRRGLNIRHGAEASVALSRDVPMALQLEFGAGEASIDLGGVSLRGFSIATGASETNIAFSRPNPIEADRVRIEVGAADLRVTGLGNVRARRIDFQGGVGATVLDFGGTWQRDAAASVQMGIGSLTLRFPRSIGVRIHRSSVLTSFSAPGFERDGNTYLSDGWAAAEHRLTIDLNAALGSVDVQWID
jgi:hypothetical protein